MDSLAIGKWLLFFGLGVSLLGTLIWGGAKIGLPLGKFPGDMKFGSEKFVLYLPLITSLLLSLFLTVIINLVLWLFKR